MATKKTISKKSPSLETSTQNESQVGEFLLVDYRIVKIIAEQHISPELAKKGMFVINEKTGEISIPDEGEPTNGKLRYFIELNGYKSDEESDENKEKSFHIELEIEGNFKIIDCKISKGDDMKNLLPPIYQQIRVIAMEKVRNLAHDLGYRGVRPILGLKRLILSEISEA